MDKKLYTNNKVHLEEAFRRLNESNDSEVIAQYSIDIYQDSNMSATKMEKLIWDILQNNGITVAGCMFTDTSWSVEDYF